MCSTVASSLVCRKRVFRPLNVYDKSSLENVSFTLSFGSKVNTLDVQDKHRIRIRLYGMNEETGYVQPCP
jgi:hypothetical protein